MKAPGDARVPRLAVLLASLRCLRRRGSPSAPAPFSPTHCRPLCDRDHYSYSDRRKPTRAFLTHGLDRLQLRTATATGVSSCRADARYARSRRTARTRAARTEFRDGPFGPWASRGARARLSLTHGLPAPRAALGPGVRFATPVRHPTQSSSLLLGARPDPHPVVGVRIGPSRLRLGFRCVVHGPVRRLDLPSVGRRRCSVSSRRTGATRCRRLPHPALSALPERGEVAPLGFPTALSRRLDYSDAT